MTGAISVARLGIEALSEHLLRMLNDNGKWAYDELISAVDKCFHIKCGK